MNKLYRLYFYLRFWIAQATKKFIEFFADESQLEGDVDVHSFPSIDVSNKLDIFPFFDASATTTETDQIEYTIDVLPNIPNFETSILLREADLLSSTDEIIFDPTVSLLTSTPQLFEFYQGINWIGNADVIASEADILDPEDKEIKHNFTFGMMSGFYLYIDGYDLKISPQFKIEENNFISALPTDFSLDVNNIMIYSDTSLVSAEPHNISYEMDTWEKISYEEDLRVFLPLKNEFSGLLVEQFTASMAGSSLAKLNEYSSPEDTLNLMSPNSLNRLGYVIK